MDNEDDTDLIRNIHDGRLPDIYSFGRVLVKTMDLDPVYVILWEAKQRGILDETTMKRYLLAYWCFYHMGTSAEMTAAPDEMSYWDRMELAAASKDYPRSTERRHFRGEMATKSVAFLRNIGVDQLFLDLEDAGTDAKKFMWRIQHWRGFGPWIAFKAADMVERLGIQPLEFTSSTVMYDSPQEAAELLWRVEHTGEGRRTPNHDEGEWAIGRILSEVGNPEIGTLPGFERLDPVDAHMVASFQRRLAMWAPPRFDRPLGPQEAETILCKWKSHVNGHYKLGEDLRSTRQSFLQFSRCKLAQALYRCGRYGGLWL